MRRFGVWLRTALMALLFAVVILFTQTWFFKPLKLEWFYTRAFASLALESPEMLTSLGMLSGWLDFHSSRLDDASLAQERATADEVRANMATLEEYDRNALGRGDQLSYDILHYYLGMEMEGNTFQRHFFEFNPAYGEQNALPEFMTELHQIRSKSEAKAYIARLRLFPQKFAQKLEGTRLSEEQGIFMPRFAIERVLEQMQAYTGKPAKEHQLYLNLRDKLAAIPAESMDEATRASLLADAEAAIRHQVYPAYAQLIAHYADLLPRVMNNHGAWSTPDGDAYYAWAVRKHTTTDLTPRQVHELGLAEVAKVGAQMEKILLAQGLREGSIGARVQQLASDPRQHYPDTPEGRQALLEHFRVLVSEADRNMGRAFDLRPKQKLEVRAVPEVSQASGAGAYYLPAAIDGSRPAVFYVNLRAPREVPKFAMRTVVYHETMPGHHMQLSVAQEMQDVPFFRRVIPFTAYQEGWGLYAERLAGEMGLEPDPLDSLGRLRDEMMRATRLVIDSGIHYKRWTREQAIAYMVENTGMGEQEVTAEVERYFVLPGYALAYKVGMLTILGMRERAKQELGDKFDLKQFHREVLSHGALPLIVLNRVVDDWIAQRRKS
ncbi:DUF885 domain-containing protein [Massilia sp. MB5]|uniref:DUF885 domain-containing protein n=1 Tax=Massilia sp. MB5 TaxID=2919578 RepID=UPI001F117D47|nr:DUF885 domain-containing protein [Massilia sp. MB5]UMR28735.1 DUF885 domain-containing protein [Massilia sp. MB5]